MRQYRPFLAALAATLLAGAMTLSAGCATTKPEPEGNRGPLKTQGTTTPPQGCVELRKRGGSC